MKKVDLDLKKLYDPATNPKQMLAHQVPETYLLYGGAYGGGKTAFIVNEGIRLSIVFPGNRGFIGCDEFTKFQKNALQQLIHFLPKDLIATHHQGLHYFNLKNGSQILYGGIGKDAQAEEMINNFPALGWFAIDQAEDITERQFLLLCGRLRLQLPNIRYKGLLTANPDPGWLRTRFIESSLRDHRFIPALPEDNKKYLPPDYEAKLRAIYPKEMAERLLTGDWDISASPNLLIPYRYIREAIKREIEPKGEKVAGVDIAYEGGDETVWILRHGQKVIDIQSWSYEDTQFTAGKVATLIRKWKTDMVYMDSIGIGVGALDPLKNEGFAVQGINVSERALNKEVYLNKRAEYYGLLGKRFEDGEISIPDHQKLQSQLSAIKYEYINSRLRIWDKKRLKLTIGKSPDYADALMLCFIGSDGVSMSSGVSDRIPVTHWG